MQLIFTFLITSILLFGCLPPAPEKIEDFNDDSASNSTPKSIDDIVPSIYSTGPSSSSLSFSKYQNSPQTFYIYVANDENYTFNVKWSINGTTKSSCNASKSSNPYSCSFIPINLSPITSGTVVASISDQALATTLDSFTWNVSLINPDVVYTDSPSIQTTITSYNQQNFNGWSNIPSITIDNSAQNQLNLSGASLKLVWSIGSGTTYSTLGEETGITLGTQSFLTGASGGIVSNLADWATYAITLTDPFIQKDQYIKLSIEADSTFSGVIKDDILWNFSTLPINTPPSISTNSPAFGTNTITQSTSDYVFNILASDIEDPTFSTGTISFFSDSGLTNLLGSCTGVTTCSYTHNFPTYNDSTLSFTQYAPGTFTFIGVITDGTQTQSDSTYVDTPSSVSGTWIYVVTEIQTPSYFQISGIKRFGETISDPSSEIFIVGASDPSAPINELTEGDSFTFNLLIGDDERDNYYLKIESDTGSGFEVLSSCTPGTGTLITRTSATLLSHQTVACSIGEDFIDSPTYVQGVKFRATVTGAHTSGLENPTTYQFPDSFKITNFNPDPTFIEATTTPATTTSGPHIIMTGFPFIISTGNDITDSSTLSSGSTITYQWKIDADCNAVNTPSDYDNIPSATTGTLTWTPPPDMEGRYACFLLCLGDEDPALDNNIQDCGNYAGPWTGTSNNFVQIIDSKKQIVADNFYEIDSYYEKQNSSLLYTAYVDESTSLKLKITEFSKTGSGGESIVSNSSKAFSISDSLGVAQRPSNLSISKVPLQYGNLLMAYRYYDTGSSEWQINVMKTDSTGSLISKYYVDPSSYNYAGMGKIEIHSFGSGTYWYLPTISENTTLDIFYGDTESDSTYFIKASDKDFYDISGNIDRINDNLVILGEGTSGDWDLLSLTLPTNALSTSSIVTDSEGSSIFGSSNFSKPHISDNSVSNPYIYITGINQDSFNQIYLIKLDTPTGTNIDFVTDLQDQTIPNLDDYFESSLLYKTRAIKGIQLSPGTTPHELFISTVGDNNLIYLIKLDTDPNNNFFNNPEVLSSNVSHNLIPQSSFSSDSIFKMSNLIPNYYAGNFNSTSKDIFFILYESNGGQINSVIINSEKENFSTSAEDFYKGFFPGYFR